MKYGLNVFGLEMQLILENGDISTEIIVLSPNLEIYRRNLLFYLRKWRYIDRIYSFIPNLEIYRRNLLFYLRMEFYRRYLQFYRRM